ncbi:MAG TPA: hypothetical protein PKE29_00710 [Phycisphaerales bacterium]|nr:hypothetical protein [Phycisphaerales bacterium]
MTTPLNRNSRPKARPSRRQEVRQRAVASILAMMFLVMFGSLSVAMAIASQGNLRTAATHLHVVKAMGAAETGMAIAQKQLGNAIARFVCSKGVVDSGMGGRLWTGTTTSSDGTVTILPASNGRIDSVLVRGVADALISAHSADANIVTASGFPTTPGMFTPGSVDTLVYKASDWVRTPLIGLDTDVSVAGSKASAYQITYAPLANGTDVRIIVTGYSSVGASGSGYLYQGSTTDTSARLVGRTIQQDVRIAKRPRQAMLSPSRIMLGKNVVVNGNLGARYTDVARTNGDPIQTKGDFDKLNNSLDAKLARFRLGCKQYDTDGDNRLRISHPTESQGLPGAAELTSNGWPAGAFADATHDGYVDEFDIFLNHYDTNGDGDVVLSSRFTTGTINAGRSPEFTDDDDLALLIDSGNADRNRNGVSGFADPNDNNRITPVSSMLDPGDRGLGWRDGVINYKDQYAKIRGRMLFSANSGDWAAARGGSYADLLQGPVIPAAGDTATHFDAGADELPALDQTSFNSAGDSLKAIANGTAFDTQVAANLGISTVSLATYTEAAASLTAPMYFRKDLADSYVVGKVGQHIWEKMPFNSPAYADYYYRPRYQNMTFKNVQIPMGTNALFVKCTFIGVTYVRSYADNTHPNWSLYGQMVWDTSAGSPVANTQALDKSDFPRYTTGNVADGPANYSSFPDPPVINGSTKTGASRDTKLYSNNIRFHDCLFVGSIVGDTPTTYTNIRNKMQFTGSTRFTTSNPTDSSPSANPSASDLVEINKSSLMLPNYSVDVGSYDAPTDAYTGSGAPASQNIHLSGSIVAGVMDIRGNARVDGALFMTFAPVFGQGPLQQNGVGVGNPANFNSTIGYFGTTDGDGEAIDPSTLPIVGGQRIVGYDTDGDGIPDVDATQTQPGGSTPIPFYGYGRVEINYNPTIQMPDGIPLALSAVPLMMTYREGKP